jgi:GT2 family glycosyltransferase
MNDSLRPDISICIANYNGGDLVLECLESVYAQEGGFRIEVIVHDDASTDDSLERIKDRFPSAIAIESTTNAGFCISNNRMAERASGRYLLLLNNDARLRPGSLQALLTAADGSMQDCILGLPQCSMTDGSIVDHGYRTDPFLNPIPIMDTGTHEAGVATGACLWIPKRVWNAIGGFPEWFESIAEDIFICLAARLLGHRVAALDGPAFDHWIGKNLGGGKVVNGALRSTVRRRALSERNKTFVMLCCYPWQALLFLLPLHVASLCLEAAFLVASGIPVKSVGRIYAGIPYAVLHCRSRIYALRKHLMRQRKATSKDFFAFTDWLPQKVRLLFRHGRPTLN